MFFSDWKFDYHHVFIVELMKTVYGYTFVEYIPGGII